MSTTHSQRQRGGSQATCRAVGVPLYSSVSSSPSEGKLNYLSNDNGEKECRNIRYQHYKITLPLPKGFRLASGRVSTA